MHSALIFCVLFLAACVGILFWRVANLTKGQDMLSERMDDLIGEAGKLAGKVDSTTQAMEGVKIIAGNIGTLVERYLEEFKISVAAQLAESNERVSDLIEGCAKMDADLSIASEDVRECVRLRQSDLEGLNARITEIADAQEKARRKSGLHNAPGAYESLRAVAETGARKHPDPAHAQLVALAQGPE